jgi:hypothetical protein
MIATFSECADQKQEDSQGADTDYSRGLAAKAIDVVCSRKRAEQAECIQDYVLTRREHTNKKAKDCAQFAVVSWYS